MIDNREDNKWAVYVHIVPKELSGYEWDKYYVGITSQTPKNRWKNGFGYKDNQIIRKAIEKYKWNNIQHDIVASNLTEFEAKSMEIKLISLLRSNQKEYGYNRTSGGDGHAGDINVKRKNYINCTFEDLTVIYDLPDKVFPSGQTGRIEMCRCSCGKEFPVLLRNLITKNTTSCGHNGKPNRRIYNQYDLSGSFGIGYTSKNEKFYFDIEDYDKIKDYCWRIHDKSNTLISEKCLPKRKTFEIIHLLYGFESSGKPINISHKNNNLYDFRKDNIIFNPPNGLSSDKYISFLKTNNKYISWNSTRTKWQVKIHNNTKHFTQLNDAISYRDKIIELNSSFFVADKDGDVNYD